MYINPKTVLSPKEKIRNLRVIYDSGDGGWSLGKMIYENEEVIGIRWNGDEKTPLGHPISNSHPVWFILPQDISKLVEAYATIMKTT